MARKSPFTGASLRAEHGASLRAEHGASLRAEHDYPTDEPASSGVPGGLGGTATATVAALGLKTDVDSELDLDDAFAAPLSSYLDAKPPHRTRRPPSRTESRQRGRGLRRWVAVPVLALLVVAGLVVTSVIVGLVRTGMNAATGASAAESPLVVPAPGLAAGLPRHYLPVHDIATQQLIAEFIRRFTAVTGTFTGHPAALYREPGTIDMANQPGWVMYLGHNSAASLGSSEVTIGRVMAVLIGTSGPGTSWPGTSWPAAPGLRGGSAACALTQFGATAVTLCAWATAHTIGALMSPTADTRRNELAVLMPLMRLDLQPGPSSRHVPGRAFV